jgi:hypothetical protein
MAVGYSNRKLNRKFVETKEFNLHQKHIAQKIYNSESAHLSKRLRKETAISPLLQLQYVR